MASDADTLDAALRALSESMGDVHAASRDDILRAGFGTQRSCWALIAEEGGVTGGVTVYSPMFSTVRGAAGIYVSDLWVSESARGTGLGRRLLAAALADARERWGAEFIKLAVYHDNSGAQGFYARLGFTENVNERYLVLSGPELAQLQEGTDESDT